MKVISQYVSLVSLLFLILVSTLLAEDVKLLSLGDPVPDIRLIDQFDRESPLPPGTEKIIFISDMDASKITHPIFEKEGNPYLEKNLSVLVSDIHRMPFLISKFIALPKMRSYSYTIRLIREEKIGDPFPRNKGQVTLIQLKAGIVSQISFAKSEEEVRDFLESKSDLKTEK